MNDTRQGRFERKRMVWLSASMPLVLALGALTGASSASGGAAGHRGSRTPLRATTPHRSPLARSELPGFTARYCVSCHNNTGKTAGLALDVLSRQPIENHPETWERVVRKLRGRQMPPLDRTRPDERTYEAVSTSCTADGGGLPAPRSSPIVHHHERRPVPGGSASGTGGFRKPASQDSPTGAPQGRGAGAPSPRRMPPRTVAPPQARFIPAPPLQVLPLRPPQVRIELDHPVLRPE